MSQKTTGLYRLTQIPAFYESFQNLLGATASRRRLVQEYILAKEGEQVLDLGCGPATILEAMPDVSYLGIDLNAAQIEQARRDYGDRGQFHCGDFNSLKEEIASTFDLVLVIGLLHHIDDGRVRELASLAASFLKPSGRLLAVDPVYTDDQTWIARRLAAADSGRCVRTADGYRDLVASAFKDCVTHVRHDLLRIPYSHCITVARN